MDTRSVEQVIAHHELAKTRPDASVSDACYVLARYDVGALAVLEDERLVGVVSERDVIRKCICRSRQTSATLVSEIMTPDPITVEVGTSLRDALRIMVESGFRHLPVVEQGRARGMLSMRDIPTRERLEMEHAAATAGADAAD